MRRKKVRMFENKKIEPTYKNTEYDSVSLND